MRSCVGRGGIAKHMKAKEKKDSCMVLVKKIKRHNRSRCLQEET